MTGDKRSASNHPNGVDEILTRSRGAAPGPHPAGPEVWFSLTRAMPRRFKRSRGAGLTQRVDGLEQRLLALTDRGSWSCRTVRFLMSGRGRSGRT